jgi:hypothetical protein
MGKLMEAWHQLSEDEQKALLAKVNAALDQVGGKRVIQCTPSWCTEEWHFWGVEEFPSLEAVMKHTQIMANLHWHRYVESYSMLGTELH